LTTTSNLGLTVYSGASGSETTFLNYRLSQAGLSGNMSIIDSFAGDTSASIVSVKNGVIFDVDATQISSNYFENTRRGKVCKTHFFNRFHNYRNGSISYKFSTRSYSRTNQ